MIAPGLADRMGNSVVLGSHVTIALPRASKSLKKQLPGRIGNLRSSH
jgi:hypothetical protein